MQADLGLLCVKKEAMGKLDEQQRGGSAERIMGKCLLWVERSLSRGKEIDISELVQNAKSELNPKWSRGTRLLRQGGKSGNEGDLLHTSELLHATIHGHLWLSDGGTLGPARGGGTGEVGGLAEKQIARLQSNCRRAPESRVLIVPCCGYL